MLPILAQVAHNPSTKPLWLEENQVPKRCIIDGKIGDENIPIDMNTA